MNSNVFNFINILSTGFVIGISITIFLLGSKVISTRFNALFWGIISIYLTTSLLKSNHLISFKIISGYTQFFIPAGYGLFIMVNKDNKFRYRFLLIFIIPFVSLFFFKKDIFSPIYHLVFWTILIIISIRIKKNNDLVFKGKNEKIMNVIVILLISLSVLPFISYNLVNILILKKDIVIESMLPPCIALASLLGLFFAYYNNLLVLNHDFYMNLDLLKKSSSYEKKTIIEKISASLIHEIKNPVAAIQSLNQQLKEKIKTLPEEKVLKYLETIGNDLDKIKEISNSFLKTCKREKNSKKESIKIMDLLNTVYSIIKYDLEKKNILLIIDNSNADKNVIFDSYKFRQIILNLVYNAIEAEAKNIRIYSKKENKNIKIYIEDDGFGINKTDKNNIFTPFFSTKLDGTGMGLSICKELLNEVYGNIELVSSENGKTIFLITFVK